MDSWGVDYEPDDAFADVFGVSYEGTLLAALKAGGGGSAALGRHAVAALLNANNPDVSYAYSVNEIMSMVQSAFASGDFEFIKDQFAQENESGCPLD